MEHVFFLFDILVDTLNRVSGF